MPNIHLTMAMNDYDHIRDLANGVVRAEGIDITALTLSVEEIFFRMIKNLEFQVSEMSFGKYCSTMSQPNLPFVGIPVFPSRIFRQSAFFINRKGKVKKPEHLKGTRIGIPEWSQTATIYARGWIQHQLGIPLRDIKWFQSGINDPGRLETAKLKLPEGVTFTPVRGRSLAEMLLDGDLDAVITAHPPRLFEEGHPDIVRLIPDYRPAEEAYFKETGVFPIMHTVAIRSDVYEQHAWALMSLYTAFEAAKKRSEHRVMEITASQIAVPWGYESAAKVNKAVFGEHGFWPYGIEPNRTTIKAFLQFCFEQGVCHRKLEPEELYPKEVQSAFKV